jgi:hypothetical protein
MSEKHVEQLIEKAAAKTTNSIEAMQFSQAAVNAAMALNNLKMFRMADIQWRSSCDDAPEIYSG